MQLSSSRDMHTHFIKYINLGDNYFIRRSFFHSFVAGNCISNSSFKWMKNRVLIQQHKGYRFVWLCTDEGDSPWAGETFVGLVGANPKRYRTNAGLLLAHRLRRWTSIKPAPVYRLLGIVGANPRRYRANAALMLARCLRRWANIKAALVYRRLGLVVAHPRRYRTNAGLMLARCLRRWTNIKPALVHHLLGKVGANPALNASQCQRHRNHETWIQRCFNVGQKLPSVGQQ